MRRLLCYRCCSHFHIIRSLGEISTFSLKSLLAQFELFPRFALCVRYVRGVSKGSWSIFFTDLYELLCQELDRLGWFCCRRDWVFLGVWNNCIWAFEACFRWSESGWFLIYFKLVEILINCISVSYLSIVCLTYPIIRWSDVYNE